MKSISHATWIEQYLGRHHPAKWLLRSYMSHGTDSRTLTSGDQLFTITLDESIELYKQLNFRHRGTLKLPIE